jgi:transposase-like protein
MIYLITNNKTGSSLLYLMRLLDLGCYKTAWTMAHKIHKAMYEQDQATKLAGLIELDDSYFGERNVTGKRGRGAAGKKPVFIAVGTKVVKGKVKPSYLRMQVSENLTGDSVKEFMQSCIKPGSSIKTDRFKSFHFIKDIGFQHHSVKIINPKETLEHLPWVHIMIGNIKGLLKGVHHGVSAKHLQRFLSEFCYKFNRRFVERRMFSDLLIACLNTSTITFTELRT